MQIAVLSRTKTGFSGRLTDLKVKYCKAFHDEQGCPFKKGECSRYGDDLVYYTETETVKKHDVRLHVGDVVILTEGSKYKENLTNKIITIEKDTKAKVDWLHEKVITFTVNGGKDIDILLNEEPLEGNIYLPEDYKEVKQKRAK